MRIGIGKLSILWGNDGHRQDHSRGEGGTGAISVGASGECAGGSEPNEGAREHSGVEIIAWRTWLLLDDGVLCSVTYKMRWEGPVVRADCVPTRKNNNGIYAVRDLADAPITPVWGEVALSGTVVEGQYGYRAEIAAIRSIYVNVELREVEPNGITPPGTWEEWPNERLIRALEKRYDTSVTRRPSPMITAPQQAQLQQYQYLSRSQQQQIAAIGAAAQQQQISYATQLSQLNHRRI